jgi:phytoene dehydrogenase-like protein
VHWITPASVHDATVAPPGEHVVTATVTVPYDIGTPWPELRDGCRERVLRAIEDALPGFSSELRFAEVATPTTFQRFSLNINGAIHSWEQTVRQTEARRPAQVTPIDGLYLCSQWTNIGGGFLRAFVCGISTAKMLLTAQGRGESVPDFRSVPVPPLDGAPPAGPPDGRLAQLLFGARMTLGLGMRRLREKLRNRRTR